MMTVTPLPPSDTAVMAKLHTGLGGIREKVEGADRVPRKAVREAKQDTDRRLRRFWLPIVLVVAVASSTLTAVGMYFYFGPQIETLRIRQAAADAAGIEVQRVAQEARDQAKAANLELERRGQAPVPVPEVGEATDADVLVSAATARVLASLPQGQTVTAGAVAAAVADFMARNPPTPIGPSTAQIADQVATYLRANPPAPGVPGVAGDDGARGLDGDPGQMGEPGRPPTAAEIRAALDQFFLDNPIPPCPSGTALQDVQFGTLGPSGLACVFTTQPPQEPDDGGLLGG